MTNPVEERKVDSVEESKADFHVHKIHYGSDGDFIESKKSESSSEHEVSSRDRSRELVKDILSLKDKHDSFALIGDINVSLLSFANGKYDLSKSKILISLISNVLGDTIVDSNDHDNINKAISEADSIDLDDGILLQGYQVKIVLPQNAMSKERVLGFGNEQVSKSKKPKAQESQVMVFVTKANPEDTYKVDVKNYTGHNTVQFAENLHSDHIIQSEKHEGKLYVNINAFDPQNKTSNLTEAGNQYYSTLNEDDEKVALARLAKLDIDVNTNEISSYKTKLELSEDDAATYETILEVAETHIEEVFEGLNEGDALFKLASNLKPIDGDKDWDKKSAQDKFIAHMSSAAIKQKVEETIARRKEKSNTFSADDLVTNVLIPVFGLQTFGGFEIPAFLKACNTKAEQDEKFEEFQILRFAKHIAAAALETNTKIEDVVLTATEIANKGYDEKLILKVADMMMDKTRRNVSYFVKYDEQALYDVFSSKESQDELILFKESREKLNKEISDAEISIKAIEDFSRTTEYTNLTDEEKQAKEGKKAELVQQIAGMQKRLDKEFSDEKLEDLQKLFDEAKKAETEAKDDIDSLKKTISKYRKDNIKSKHSYLSMQNGIYASSFILNAAAISIYASQAIPGNIGAMTANDFTVLMLASAALILAVGYTYRSEIKSGASTSFNATKSGVSFAYNKTSEAVSNGWNALPDWGVSSNLAKAYEMLPSIPVPSLNFISTIWSNKKTKQQKIQNGVGEVNGSTSPTIKQTSGSEIKL